MAPVSKRIALLIQGSLHKNDPEAPLIRNSIRGSSGDASSRRGLASVLRDDLRFDEVRILEGSQVTESGLIQALDDIEKLFKTDGNVLFVHWVGHGLVSKSGDNPRERDPVERQLLTYYSQRPADGDAVPTKLLSLRSFNTLLESKQDLLRERGKGSLFAVSIDVGAVGHRSVGQLTGKYWDSGRFALEGWSAGEGQDRFFEEGNGTERSVWTGALTDSLFKQSQGNNVQVDLHKAFEAAKRATRKQESKIEGGSVIAFNPKSHALRVKFVDANDPSTQLIHAESRLMGQKLLGGAVAFSGLRKPDKQGYRLQVKVPGYRDRRVLIESEGANDVEELLPGGLLVVPLVRDFVLVRGSIYQPKGQKAVVGVPSISSDESYIWETQCSVVGSGPFELRLPANRLEFDWSARSKLGEQSGQLDLSTLKTSRNRTDQFGALEVYTLNEPIALGVKKVIVRGKVKQNAELRSVISIKDRSSVVSDEVLGSDQFELELNSERGQFTVIASVNGKQCGSLPIELLAGKAQLVKEEPPYWRYDVGTLKVVHGGLVLKGVTEISSNKATKLVFRNSPVAGSPNVLEASKRPAKERKLSSGAFEYEIKWTARPFRLLIEGAGLKPFEVDVDPKRGTEEIFNGRTCTVIDLGTIRIIDDQNQLADFWKLIAECEPFALEGEVKEVKRRLSKARKLAKKEDDRYAAIGLYESVVAVTSAGLGKGIEKKKLYSKARRPLERALKAIGDLENPNGVPLRPLGLFYLGYCEGNYSAYVAAHDKGRRDKKAWKRTEDIYEELKSSFPSATGSNGQNYCQQLKAEMTALNDKIKRMR